MSAPLTLERLYSLRELSDAGYGHTVTLARYIHEGKVPAVKIGHTFKIRESDLPAIAVPVAPGEASA